MLLLGRRWEDLLGGLLLGASGIKPLSFSFLLFAERAMYVLIAEVPIPL